MADPMRFPASWLRYAATACILSQPTALWAQGTATPTASATATPSVASRPVSAVLLAGGTDALVRDGQEWTPSAALHLGYERARPSRALGWRLAADVWTQGHGPRTIFVNGTPLRTLEYRGRSWAYGVSALAVGTVRRTSAVRPYAIAGFGVHRLSSVRRERPAPDNAPAVSPDIDAARTSLGLTTGLGIRARVIGWEVFSEGRLTVYPAGAARPIGTRRWLAPLTVGVRLPTS